MNDPLAASLALPTAAALVGLIVGLLLAGARRPAAPAAPAARPATAGGDFVRDVAKALGVDPRAVSLTGLSVEAAAGDPVATVLFQAVVVDQAPEDVRRAIVDAIRRAVLAADADADRKLTQALDQLRDRMVVIQNQSGRGPDGKIVASGAAFAITAALSEWATATVPGLTVEVRDQAGATTSVGAQGAA